MKPVMLITAGPSREYFDDVRFLSNGASGALGIALATRALAHDWDVHLALGPTQLSVPEGIHVHRFISAQDLEAICIELWPTVDTFVATAAVCDYRPAERIPGKRKKGDDDWAPAMVRTPDVLAGRGAEKGDRTLVGFSLESGAGPEEALRKLVTKNLDLILWNTPVNLGASEGRYTCVEPGGVTRELGLLPKDAVADEILRFVGEQRARRRETQHPNEDA